jgi:hypothetical protein
LWSRFLRDANSASVGTDFGLNGETGTLFDEDSVTLSGSKSSDKSCENTLS